MPRGTAYALEAVAGPELTEAAEKAANQPGANPVLDDVKKAIPVAADLIDQIKQLENALNDFQMPAEQKQQQLKKLLTQFLAEEFVNGIREGLNAEIAELDGKLKSKLIAPLAREQLFQKRFELKLESLTVEYVQRQQKDLDDKEIAKEFIGKVLRLIADEEKRIAEAEKNQGDKGRELRPVLMAHKQFVVAVKQKVNWLNANLAIIFTVFSVVIAVNSAENSDEEEDKKKPDEAEGEVAPKKAAADYIKQTRHEFEKSGGVREQYWKNEYANNREAYKQNNQALIKQGKAPFGTDGKPMILHHKTPIEYGGTNDFSNLLPMRYRDHSLTPILVPCILLHSLIEIAYD